MLKGEDVQPDPHPPTLLTLCSVQVFLPHDGKRLRLRNTPRDDDSMDIRLRLAADKKVRLVTTELVRDSNLDIPPPWCCAATTREYI